MKKIRAYHIYITRYPYGRDSTYTFQDRHTAIDALGFLHENCIGYRACYTYEDKRGTYVVYTEDDFKTPLATVIRNT